MSFNTKRISGGVGVEVSDLDVTQAISQSDADAIRQLWLDEGVVVFKGLGTSPNELLNISRCLGELEPHPIEHFRLDGYPELIELSNAKGFTGPIYNFDGEEIYGRIPWHTDLAFTTTPNAGAVLRMVRNSEHAGQTGWIDTAKAWEALSLEVKAQIEGLEAVYVFCPDLSAMRFNKPGGTLVKPTSKAMPEFPPVAHPLVWVHPDTGSRILNISTLNIQRIIGLSDEDSDALIEHLVQHTLQPQFQYIHNWENNDVVAWDNRRTMHMAFGHPAQEIRTVQRSTVRGTVVMGRILDTEEAA